MQYEKPEVVPLALAVDTIQSCNPKELNSYFDQCQRPLFTAFSPAAYDADE